MIEYETPAIASARVAEILARIYTTRVGTAEVDRTVLIGGTLGTLAQNLWVTQVASQTLARGVVVFAAAFSVRSATIFQDARVYALLVKASVGVRTVTVGLALNCLY